MKRISAIFSVFALALALGACDKSDSSKESKEAKEAKEAKDDKTTTDQAFGEVEVEELASLIEKGACAVFDSNGESVRKESGKIPGATLLSSSSDYDVSKLPEDKASKLVFYCANSQCGASHASAEKALAAGYTDVNILPAGIEGWKEAGKPTEKAM